MGGTSWARVGKMCNLDAKEMRGGGRGVISVREGRSRWEVAVQTGAEPGHLTSGCDAGNTTFQWFSHYATHHAVDGRTGHQGATPSARSATPVPEGV